MKGAARLNTLVAGPAAGFDLPFDMLQACHERVTRTLDLLQRLRAHVDEQGASEPARQAARDVMRYFDLAAPAHHEDEERHVFPPVLVNGDARQLSVVQRLQADHLAMVEDWAQARGVLKQLAEGGIAMFDAAQRSVLDQFAQRYPAHIALEEELVYPAARRCLGPADQTAMGNEMARRRGAA